MGKLTGFYITIDGGRQVYYPGEVISGQLNVTLAKPMKMRGISITLHGKAHCHWTETHGSGDNRRTHHYSGNQVLLDCCVPAYGDGNNSQHHPEGNYVYRFSYTLPTVLPSSFEASHGYIRYFLKAKIDKPWKFDHTSKLPLIINEVIDTNNPAFLNQPGAEKSKEVGCCCCPSGTVSIRGNVDRQAYCPGESILVTAECHNATTRDMRTLKAKLLKEIIYNATSKTRRDHEVIARVEGDSIARGQFANWHNQPFGIPPTAPSITTAHVVQVHYYLVLEVDIPMAFDLDIKLPIILGTVPFRATYGMPPAVPLMPPLPEATAPPMPNSFPMMPVAPPPMNILGYPDMAPPSYAAAVGQQGINIKDDDDNEHTQGTLSYTPIYTFAQPQKPM